MLLDFRGAVSRRFLLAGAVPELLLAAFGISGFLPEEKCPLADALFGISGIACLVALMGGMNFAIFAHDMRLSVICAGLFGRLRPYFGGVPPGRK
jgi:hypothetical protein